MSKFTMLVGIPGCGKSTWLKQHQTSEIVVSPDHIRSTLSFMEDMSITQTVWQVARYIAVSSLMDNKDVILDATNVNTFLRREFLMHVCECPALVIEAVIFNTNPEVAYERIKKDIRQGVARSKVPEDVVYRMWGELQYTKKAILEEKFDKITEMDG